MSDAHAVARDQLRAFIERIERLEEEKKTIADDIKDVKAEAKGCGFDVGIINAVLKLRKIDANERAERDAMLDTYLVALGMLPEPAGDDEDYGRETGEVTIIDREDEDGNHIRVTVDPQIAAILGRQSAVPLRSDGGLNSLTKHQDIRTAPVTAEEISRPAALAVSGGEPSIPSPDAGGEKMDGSSHPGRSDDMSAYCYAKSGQATHPSKRTEERGKA